MLNLLKRMWWLLILAVTVAIAMPLNQYDEGTLVVGIEVLQLQMLIVTPGILSVLVYCVGKEVSK